MWRRFIATGVLLLTAGNVLALGMVSRACPVADIPSSMKLAALTLFEVIGDAPIGSLTRIRGYNQNEQYNWWVLESITTDYGSVRYYLFAENKAYRYDDFKNAYFLEVGYKSPGWVAMAVSEETYKDSRFEIFFANRGFLYSARAGHKDIVQRWSRKSPAPGSTPLYKDFWWVLGQHYYYDPVAKTVGYLGNTFATDCNLGQWGFGHR